MTIINKPSDLVGHVKFGPGTKVVIHLHNNTYEFCATCIAMWSNFDSFITVAGHKPLDRRFFTLKNDVGVQHRREVDEIWFPRTVAVFRDLFCPRPFLP